MTLVLRTAIRRGPRDAIVTGLGVCLGSLMWGVAAAVGVSALLTRHPAAYRVFAYAGAAYLCYLGIRMLVPSAGAGHGPAGDGADGESEDARRPVFLQGLLTNLLNPKIGVFYVSVTPQFPVPGVSPAVVGLSLAGFHACVGMMVFGAIVAFTRSLGAWLTRPRVARGLDVLCGVVLIAFGILVALRA